LEALACLSFYLLEQHECEEQPGVNIGTLPVVTLTDWSEANEVASLINLDRIPSALTVSIDDSLVGVMML
jgi:hypothetical protein